MRTILLAACFLLLAAEAQAVSRYDPTRMSCDRVQATIARQGAVILRYQSTRVPGLPLYDRYVRHSGYCARHQSLEKVYIPSDGGQCLVQHCVSRPDNCIGALRD